MSEIEPMYIDVIIERYRNLGDPDFEKAGRDRSNLQTHPLYNLGVYLDYRHSRVY